MEPDSEGLREAKEQARRTALPFAAVPLLEEVLDARERDQLREPRW